MIELTQAQKAYIETRKAIREADAREARKAELDALWTEYRANDWLGEADRAVVTAKHKEQCRLWRLKMEIEAELSLRELDG